MRKLHVAVFVLAVALSLLLPSPGYATVLGFGPICSGLCETQIHGGYGGFAWSSDFYAVGNDYYMSSYGNTYGAPSGGAAFNGFGDLDVTMTGGGSFTFDGAFFTGWADNNGPWGEGSNTITMFMYDAGSNLLGTVSTALSFDSYNWVGVGIANVSEVVFQSDGQSRWWLMDNFTYNAAAVPEPTSMLLFGTAVLGLAGMMFRRKL